MKKVIIRENLKDNEINYLVQYKSSLDDYKKNYRVLVNADEKDYLLNNNDAKVLKEVKGLNI